MRSISSSGARVNSATFAPRLAPAGSLRQQQSLRLGEYFQQKGLRFDAVLTGTLRRHQQTYAGIREGMDTSPTARQPQGAGSPLLWPDLNEYDSAAVIAATTFACCVTA